MHQRNSNAISTKESLSTKFAIKREQSRLMCRCAIHPVMITQDYVIRYLQIIPPHKSGAALRSIAASQLIL